MTPAADVFAALADPTRRQILALVARHGPLTPTDLARHVPISRQGVAKHLAVLDAAGLVTSRRAGREVHYRATPAPLAEVRAWLDDVGAQWDRRLAALGDHLTPTRSPDATEPARRPARSEVGSGGPDGRR